MASAAFKSTTKRTPIGNSPSTNADDSYSNRNSSVHRRSRSLSRFSRRLPDPLEEDVSDEAQSAPRAKFVNTARGSGFPEVSLDDLSVQFFNSGDRGRSDSRNGDISSGENRSGSQRRGRSVSRQSLRVGEGKASGGNNYAGGGNNYGSARVNPEFNPRRRRSVSVVRYQISDSESDPDRHQNTSTGTNSKNFTYRNGQAAISNRTAISNHRQGLRRSLSQKDLKLHDDYLNQHSLFSDDDGKDAESNKNVIEKTIRAVYTEKKAREKANTSGLADDGCYGSMNSDAFRPISTIKRKFATQLERSEQRKKDLLAEMVLEEQRGRELSKLMKELLSDSRNTVIEKPLQSSKSSNDRSGMSKRLTDEAEKYIEDFLSNVEDTTDFSSLDGERSDATSSLGGRTKTETFQTPQTMKSLPVEMEGVTLPWLKWETFNDASLPSRFNIDLMATPKSNIQGIVEVATPKQRSNGHGSGNPGIIDAYSSTLVKGAWNENTGSYHKQPPTGETRRTQFDMEEYIKRPKEEDFLLERWRQQEKIHSGSLSLCNQMFF